MIGSKKQAIGSMVLGRYSEAGNRKVLAFDRQWVFSYSEKSVELCSCKQKQFSTSGPYRRITQKRKSSWNIWRTIFISRIIQITLLSKAVSTGTLRNDLVSLLGEKRRKDWIWICTKKTDFHWNIFVLSWINRWQTRLGQAKIVRPLSKSFLQSFRYSHQIYSNLEMNKIRVSRIKRTKTGI